MTLSIPGTAAIATVLLMLVATVAAQFITMGPRGLLLDFLGVLPGWKFFVHSRAGGDVSIEWRRQFPQGTATPWRTVWQSSPRGPLAWIWRPNAVVDELVWLSIHTLERRVGSGKPMTAEASHAFAFVQLIARRGAGQSEPGTDQFSLIRTTPDGERSALYTSTFPTS